LAIFSISIISLLDSALINNIFFSIAYFISSDVLPTPEKTILLGFIPALIAIFNSPTETTSAPHPSFFISFNRFTLALDLTEKHNSGLKDLNVFFKFKTFFLI
jgi:hypothetical protein